MAQFNTREEMKQKAVEVMQQLDIYKPYINGFKAKDSKPCLYTGYGMGSWLYQFPEIANKVKEYEENNNCVIFAVVYNHVRDDDWYTFLFVDENGIDITEDDDAYRIFAYVWVKTSEWCSELGDVWIRPLAGGLIRVN